MGDQGGSQGVGSKTILHMNSYGVHIFCTSQVTEFPEAYTNEIADLLNQVKDNFAFFGRGYVDDTLVKEFIPNIKDPYSGVPMNDFFELCKKIKSVYELTYEYTFIVLLTNKNHNKNWFSATDGTNIYINVNDLERFSNNQSRYPIAYQILENIFQALCGITFNENHIDSRLHENPKRCINDVCIQKSKIIQKLKSGEICENCKRLVVPEIMNEHEYQSFLKLIDSIKTPAIVKIGNSDNNTKVIEVDKTGNIKICNQSLIIEAQHKSIYIFLLLHEKPIQFNELDSYLEKITWIYQKVKHRGKEVKVISESNLEKFRKVIISGRHNQFDPTFYRKVSEINTSLKDQFDHSIVETLLIQKDKDGSYFIKIPSSKVQVDESLNPL